MNRITEEEFVRIYRYLKYRTGIDMSRKKEIIQGRLENYLRALGFQNFSEYMNAVEMDFTGQMERELVNTLTTNHTFFMREFEHFDYLRQKVLPELRQKEARKKDLCIWCGAASTGQEPYMLAMLLKDFFNLEADAWDTRFWPQMSIQRCLDKLFEGCMTKSMWRAFRRAGKEGFYIL